MNQEGVEARRWGERARNDFPEMAAANQQQRRRGAEAAGAVRSKQPFPLFGGMPRGWRDLDFCTGDQAAGCLMGWGIVLGDLCG